MPFQEIIDWLVPFVGGSLVTALGLAWKYGHALIKGMRCLLRAELIDIHAQTVKVGKPVPVDVKTEADEVYDAYHQMGGNGVGTQLHKEIVEAHVGPDTK
ncbi:hypothetical protein OZX73_05295 [Bifidobacterium sp. ESL0775]|uniref:hypothetical protein n=1 Tax=Bifidobacterium sp. ESL0775 TaxID=2983230 RepID=UPI0023F83BE7|nr:hypothetical protein [Bifidobacterium sp. ESL0775]WEV68707.1 hypothetical protein OZX73_05295 [Bifidobacterium sp. ESL0775]